MATRCRSQSPATSAFSSAAAAAAADVVAAAVAAGQRRVGRIQRPNCTGNKNVEFFYPPRSRLSSGTLQSRTTASRNHRRGGPSVTQSVSQSIVAVE
jgi:hypothetical protein